MTADIKADTSLPPEIAKYLNILSKDPGSMVFAPLAEAYRKTGMLDEAIATAQDGLELHPNYVSGMVALGRAYYEKGLLIEAREILDQVHATAPDNIIAANILEEIKKTEARSQKSEETTEEVPQVGWAAPTVQEPEVIEAVELEEVAEAEEVEAEEEAVTTTYGEEITEELWTGESIHEAPPGVEEEVRPKREITTSTIADLYIKQGYIDKAIDIYQALYNANPYNEEIKRKLDGLKRQVEEQEQVEVKVEVEEFGVGWAEPTGQEKLAPLPQAPLKQELVGAGLKPAPTEEAIDKDTENIKRLESWLRTIQSERKV